MFSHVMIGTNDLEKAKVFYDALLGTLDIPPGRVDRHRIFYRTKTGVFSVSLPTTADNTFQNKSASLSITFTGTQRAAAAK